MATSVQGDNPSFTRTATKEGYLSIFSKSPVVYETKERIWLSYQKDGAFEKYFNQWKRSHIELANNGMLAISNNKGERIKEILHVSSFNLTLNDIGDDNMKINKYVCVKITCKLHTETGQASHFRCVLSIADIRALMSAVSYLSVDNNIQLFHTILDNYEHVCDNTVFDIDGDDDYTIRNSDIEVTTGSNLPDTDKSLTPGSKDSKKTYESVMSRTLGRKLDKLETVHRDFSIIDRRGAFEPLPVLFGNDLIHGSWWFVFGSIWMTIVSIVVVSTSYNDTSLGSDDSVLPTYYFRVAWFLLITSGILFTFGSLAFLRAANDPPIKAMFPDYYHLSTDELVGAWLFLLGIIPAIPYSCCYLIGGKSVYFLGVLLVSILAVIGAYLFVIACYPTQSAEHGRGSKILPYVLRYYKDTPFIRKHLATDWLTGTWILHWAIAFGAFLTLLYTIYSIVKDGSNVSIFVNVTGFFDCFFFLVGSAYFVSGSYPTGAYSRRLQRQIDRDVKEIVDRSLAEDGKPFDFSIWWSNVWAITKDTSVQTWNSIIPDILSLNWKEKLAVFVFAITSIVFSFISFNHLYDPITYPSIYNIQNDRLYGIEEWRRNMMCISGAASFTGVVCVVMVTKGKLSNFFWGAINSLLYGLFAYAYGYAGDAQLNLFYYLPLQFVGMYLWGKNLKATEDGTLNATVVNNKKLGLHGWIVCMTVCLMVSVVFWFEIPKFAVALSGIYYYEGLDAPRALDSICNGVSVVAQVLSLMRYEEQWYWWLTINVLQIAMYTGVAGYGIVINVVIMWSLFFINSCCGLYAWKNRASELKTVTDDDSDREASEMAEDGNSKSSSSNITVAGYDNKRQSKNGPNTSLTSSSSSRGVGRGVDECNVVDVRSVTCTDPLAFGNGVEGFLPPRSLTPPHKGKSAAANNTVKRGLIVGKFWPYHMGHHHLLTVGASNCDELYVIVCDRVVEHDPRGRHRASWIQECNPKVHVMSIVDVYDQHDSQLWARLVQTWCGFTPDMVFTSEAYGQIWAGYLGCKHMLVDQPRMTVPISGEIVRKNPLVSWKYLPAPVKGYYAIRIVVVGSESTGKTTLCKQLAEAYNTNWVPEYARSFCEEMLTKKGVSYIDNKDDKEVGSSSSTTTTGGAAAASASDEVLYDFKESDFEDFIVKQCMNEEEACRKSPTGVVFCDTNALCTLIWYERYFNKPPPRRLVELKEALMVQPTMYLLMGIEGSTLVQDGTRDGTDEIRRVMQEKFITCLCTSGEGGVGGGDLGAVGSQSHSQHQQKQQSPPFNVISGPFEGRFKRANAAVKAFVIKTEKEAVAL